METYLCIVHLCTDGPLKGEVGADEAGVVPTRPVRLRQAGPRGEVLRRQLVAGAAARPRVR